MYDFPPEFFFLQKLKMKNLKKREILLFKNTFFRHMWRHRGRKIIKKYFLKSIYHSRNLKKKFMRIGLLEKKLEGGGQIDPPPAMQPLGNENCRKNKS